MRQLYDASGQVVATSRYDPYGSLMSQSGSATSVFGYTGEQCDSYMFSPRQLPSPPLNHIEQS